MSGGKTSTKLNAPDHDYAPMETSGSGSGKRKNPPVTPTKTSAPPPAKMKTAQEQSYDNLVDAIAKLTDKVDSFGAQLRETATMVASVTRLVEINTADIKECRTKIQSLDQNIPKIVQENKELKERIAELERYKRRWNLKIHGIKGKDNEQIREEVIHILSEIAPQWTSTMGTIIDSVHRLGKRENGKKVSGYHPVCHEIPLRGNLEDDQKLQILQRSWDLIQMRRPRSSMAKDGASPRRWKKHLVQRPRWIHRR